MKYISKYVIIINSFFYKIKRKIAIEYTYLSISSENFIIYMDIYINNIYIYIKLYCSKYHKSVISWELGYNIQFFF